MVGKQAKTKAVTEFGDFQTPPELALAATRLLSRLGIQPHSIVEPTCGKGAFVAAAAQCFPKAKSIIGIDINQTHLNAAKSLTENTRVELRQGDFFKLDWERIINKAAGPWLVIGNPPWVTSAGLGAIGGDNLPKKSNFHGRMGIEAITGKSNFDISEFMLLRYLDWLKGASGIIAVLCKTAVARKVLRYAWKNNLELRTARIYKINAHTHFRVVVDTCFFILEIGAGENALSCELFGSIEDNTPINTLGFLEGHIISDVGAFNRQRHLLGPENHYVWRSGIKHDCSKVMELTPTTQGYVNGLGETCALEESYVFPMLKSSDIGNGRTGCRRVMLVTQHAAGEDTARIQRRAPQTWDYLLRHGGLLKKRGSVIYKNKPNFSIFGVGPYSFTPWKVAISGFYKSLKFIKVGPIGGRPVVFDDTVNFLPCRSEEEANFVQALLTSEAALEFFHSMVHWDEKRPITVDILKRLSIGKLADTLGQGQDYTRFTASDKIALGDVTPNHQAALLA